MFKHTKKGQSLVEYTVLVTVIIGVFIATAVYLKRGFQGRFKAAIDEMGEQYDPRAAAVDVGHTLSSETQTSIDVDRTTQGTWTSRVDRTVSNETMGGTITVEGY